MAGYDASFIDAGSVFSLFTRVTAMGEFYLHLPVLLKNRLPEVLTQVGGDLWSLVEQQSAINSVTSLKTHHKHTFVSITVLQVSDRLEAIFR